MRGCANQWSMLLPRNRAIPDLLVAYRVLDVTAPLFNNPEFTLRVLDQRAYYHGWYWTSSGPASVAGPFWPAVVAEV